MRIVSPNALTIERDDEYYITRSPDDDDTYAVDMAPFLDVGETLSTVTHKLFLLDETDDAASTEVPDGPGGLQDDPVIVGTQVHQRVRDVLTANRQYRLWLYLGDPANQRGVHWIIRVVPH